MSKFKFLKNLFSDSLIYGLSGIVTSFIGIFLIPIYTRVFDPADYGIISLLGTTFTIIFIVSIFNLDNAAAVWFWSNPTEEERDKTFSSWFWFLSCTSFLIGLIFISFAGFWSDLILRNGRYGLLVRLFGLTIMFSSFQKIVNIWFRMHRKPVHTVIFALLVSLLTIGLNIWFIVHLRWGLTGSYTAQSIAAFLGFVVCVLLLGRHVSIRNFSMDRLKEMLFFALPLLPSSLMFWLMNSASSYFLNYYSNKTEIGLYLIGAMVAGVFNLAIWAFMQAWSPFALSISHNKDAKIIYSYVLEMYCVLGLFAVFCLSFFSEEILRTFTNEKYVGGKNVIGILSASILLQGVPQILSIANAITKSNRSYSKAVIIGSILTVALFNILIPFFGKEGAALSVLLGNAVVPVLHATVIQKSYPIPYNFRRIFQGCGLLFVFIITGFWLINFSWTTVSLTIFKIGFIVISGSALMLFYRNTISSLIFEKKFSSD